MNNRKRVLRAINLGLSGPLKSQREAAQHHEPIYDCFMVVMNVERDLLNQRIEERVQTMKNQGLIDEVLTFFSSKEAQSFQSFLGIGYKEFRGFLNGTETAETAIQLIVTHTRQFAKRQLTWFRHQFEARWVNALDPSDLNQVRDEIRLWHSQEKP
jgi:tRNA dimethylallyltransferase